jgi:hypothetical protein
MVDLLIISAWVLASIAAGHFFIWSLLNVKREWKIHKEKKRKERA